MSKNLNKGYTSPPKNSAVLSWVCLDTQLCWYCFSFGVETFVVPFSVTLQTTENRENQVFEQKYIAQQFCANCQTFFRRSIHGVIKSRLQNSPYFCVLKYSRAVKQKVGNEAENRKRDWGETIKIRFFSLASHALRAGQARTLRACKTLTPRFTDFFTDFEKKTRLFCSPDQVYVSFDCNRNFRINPWVSEQRPLKYMYDGENK